MGYVKLLWLPQLVFLLFSPRQRHNNIEIIALRGCLAADFAAMYLDNPADEALKKAQMTIRSKHPHPFYWGAFICQGDPGPLRSGIRNKEILKKQTMPRSDAILEKQPSTRPKEKINRNAPCPCGSGKRYKHCCGQL